MYDRSAPLPRALEARSHWQRLGPSGIPALLVDPRDDEGGPAPPVVLWMHGRTASKELDPGRYLRLMRAGIGVCAVDLPGHGERFDAALQHPRHTLELIHQMIAEIDEVSDALRELVRFDMTRMAIGGMSAGGMAALSRLCREHDFRCAAVEASTGSWEQQRHREMFEGRPASEIARGNPIEHLGGWREIPLQAIHSRLDMWVAFDGQAAFIEALRERYDAPEDVEFVVYDRTGAPFEHAGFGRLSSDAKNRQRDFFALHLPSA
ncbi:MAG: alpha/beta fold hydrolase [Planctomycetes bacterium]|nr:alpha/beta fold hydrolase [Planctomycetota bacterium]